MRPRLILPVFLSLLLFSGNLAWADPASFDDTRAHWALREIQLVYARGIMQGVGNGLFAPDQLLTRAQLAVCLVREFNLDPVGAGTAAGQQSAAAYDDVPKTAWYADAVAACLANNILSLRGRSFNPQAPVTRLEAAVAVARCFAAKKIPAPAIAAIPGYKDTNNVSQGDQPGLALVTYAGIVRGYGGYFRPNDRLTRAEVACILCRLDEVMRLNRK